MDLGAEKYPLHAIINQVQVNRRESLTGKGLSLDFLIIGEGQQALLKYLESANVTKTTSDELKDSWKRFDHEAAEKVRLLNGRANINAMDEVGTTPLRLAVDSGNTEVVAVLLEQGADMSAGKYGGTMLHVAVRSGNEEMVQLLLNRGAILSATDENGSTTLHIAVRKGNVDMVKLLLKKKAVMKAIEEDGSTVLHVAASSGNSDMLELLLGHDAGLESPDGAGLESRDKNYRTALHIAVCYRNSKIAKLLLDRHANVAAEDEAGRTALHFAACFSNTTMISMLLDQGAKVDALDKDGNNPLSHMISVQQHELDNESVAVAHLLCSRGSNPILSESAQSSLREHQLGLLTCARYWHDCFKKGKSILNVSSNFIKGGATAVRTYLDDLENTSDGDIVKRCKLCIVGPSTWGKTSFVRSVTDGARLVMDQDDRTIGVDRFSFSFMVNSNETNEGISRTAPPNDENEVKKERYDVTFWDHAGQDIYQVSNPLFFSEKTAYLLCIDLRVYAKKLSDVKKLTDAETLTMAESEEYMQRFCEKNVLHWLRLVLLRQPDARFKLIGTKADLVSENDIRSVVIDVNTRLVSFLRSPARQVALGESALTALTEDFDVFLTPISVVTTASALEAQAMIKRMVVADPTIYFPMPKMYSEVLESIVKLQRLATTNTRREDQLRNMMLPLNAACKRLMDITPGLTARVCRDILTALHNLGDILWFKDGNNEKDDRVILDPTIVLDIIREVVNHEYPVKDDKNYDALRRDGTLHHSLLMTFPLWRKLSSVDKEMVHGFKQLLLRFNLAYPATKETRLGSADMIVPSYWLRKTSFRDPILRQESVLDRHHIHKGHVANWKYTLPVSVSEAIFVKFVVRSYRPDAKRQLSGNRFECFVDGEFAAAIYFIAHTELLYDDILIEVAADTKDIAWAEMRFFVVAMEQVLHEYPGLKSNEDNTEMQRAVDPDGDEQWHDLYFEIGNGVTEGKLRESRTWLPPDFRWFFEKVWAIPGKLNELEVSHELTVLKKLVTDSEKRLFPAVWTLSYPENSNTIEIRVHSDISGKCFHEPMLIEVPNRFIVENSAFIRGSISALSIATAAIPFAVASTAVESALSAALDWVDSTCTAQSILEKANLIPGKKVSSDDSGMSPSARMDFLLKLLKMLGYNERTVADAANLRCTPTKDGSYVWMHSSEMEAVKVHIAPCAISLQFIKAEGLLIRTNGLQGFRKQVYCTWRLIHKEDTQSMKSGKPSKALCSTEGCTLWSSNPVELENVDTLFMLKDCTLKIGLCQARQFTGCFRTDKELGNGEENFANIEFDDFSSRKMRLEIPVSLPEQTQLSQSPSVTCEVSIQFPTIKNKNA